MTIEIPTIKCGSKEVPHNTVRWKCCTNRHPTTNGNAWGWIENAPGHICWSNDCGSDFTSKQASAAVAEHNQWLEEQRPVIFRLIEARQKRDAAQRRANEAHTELQRLNATLDAAQAEVERLENLSTANSKINAE